MIVLTIEEEKLSTVSRERHNIAKGVDPVDEVDLLSLAALATSATSTWINHWFR